MLNPYANVDWQNITKIQSLSHAHTHSESTNQGFRSVKAWYDDGIRHFAFSNYYPSYPTYPIGSDTYWCRGVEADNISYAEWVQDKNDIIQSPNAEHHNIQRDNGSTVSRLHINGIGSTFSSGSPPGENPVGYQLPWKSLINSIIANLQYSDAGGATINHPTWTMAATSAGKLTESDIIEMLDYDSRVLGIEIYNQQTPETEELAWALTLWDSILATGRRCWGFAVPDHHFTGYKGGDYFGRNVLLVPSVTEYNCLKAYRDGNFYAQLGNTNLAFNNITMGDNRNLSVTCSGATSIEFTTDKGSSTINGTSGVYYIPNNARYVRVTATSANDQIFSNPIIFETKPAKRNKIIFLYD